MDSTFTIASLFSGGAGLDLGLHLAIPASRTVVYVEREAFAVDILATRMEEGTLPPALIWTDATSFYGADWRGGVDCVVGGSPCQDLSVAGKRAGLQGERSGLFYEFVRICNEVRPRFIFWENVKGAIKFMPQVCAEFESIGYRGAWTCVRASDVGAPHQRERVFLLAADSQRDLLRVEPGWRSGHDGEGAAVPREHGASGALAHADGEGQSQQSSPECEGRGWACDRRVQANPWAVEPDVGGSPDGLASQLDGAVNEASSRATELLRYVQRADISQALQRATRGLERLQAEDVLFSFVCEYENGGRLPREFLASEAAPESFLRAMQLNREPACSSLRRGSLEQFFREHPNALWKLSRLVASRGETPWSNPLWEGGIPRTATGVANRVDRLRMLGNGVVPQQAALAFRILYEFLMR